jgi:DNA-binding SARP family transcriptional activator
MPSGFRLLGPVSVVACDTVTHINGSHVRGLLASLLFHTGDIATHSHLAADVWRRPPPSAIHNMRKFVMQLRRQLQSIDPTLTERLITHTGGYSFKVEASELDFLQFRDRCSAGHSALGSGAVLEAVDHLTDALSLWHGEAGADVHVDGLLTSRFGLLNEQQLIAREELAAALIASGETLRALDELDALTTSYPVRECAAQLLLLARYRRDDVAGALAAYRDTRSRLVEELGVEPGAILRLLHRAVLKRDDSVLNNHQIAARIVTRDSVPGPLVPHRNDGRAVGRLCSPQPRNRSHQVPHSGLMGLLE